MTDVDTLPARAVPARMSELRVSADAFIEAWQVRTSQFLGIRAGFRLEQGE